MGDHDRGRDREIGDKGKSGEARGRDGIPWEQIYAQLSRRRLTQDVGKYVMLRWASSSLLKLHGDFEVRFVILTIGHACPSTIYLVLPWTYSLYLTRHCLPKNHDNWMNSSRAMS